MRTLATFAALVATLLFALPLAGAAPMSLYDVPTQTLEGQATTLGAWKGKVTLVVNLASKCGYTPQYAGLEALHKAYEGRGFAVLGFPSNEFGGQEPGTAQEIRSFCTLNYGVTFPLFEKSVTKPGPGQSPVYTFLTTGREAPAWNFAKYLVGKDGQVVGFYPSKVTPEDAGLRAAIEKALGS